MRSSVLAAAALLGAGGVPVPASAQGFSFDLVDSFPIQEAAYDALPSGRLIGLTPTGDVLLESSVGSGGFVVSNTIAPVSSSGFSPSFLSVSPDGSRIAVGNNEFGPANAVEVFDAAEFTLGLGLGNPVLPQATVATPNFDGEWSADGQRLYVSGTDASTFIAEVSRIDLSDAAIPPTAEAVIQPAGLFSGGVAFAGDELLAGDGQTGAVFAFDEATLNPLGPQTLGLGDFVGAANSASSVDALGGLVLIAGQRFGAAGDATVVDRATGATLVLTPAGPDVFYGGFFNEATNQLVVTSTNFGTGERLAFVYAIPAPGVLAVAPLAGMIAARRRWA